jgi:hypothetical protein
VRWSVGIEAEGDRVLTREQVVELADAVAASGGIATGIGSSRFGAQLVVEAASRAEAIEKATAEFTRSAARAGLPARSRGANRGGQRGRGRSRMIRLGSLAGYPFEGPRLLSGLDLASLERLAALLPGLNLSVVRLSLRLPGIGDGNGWMIGTCQVPDHPWLDMNEAQPAGEVTAD